MAVAAAALYGMPVSALLVHCGLAESDPFSLEKGLTAGQGAMLAECVGMDIAAIEAMTFRDLATPAQWLIARRARAICPRCAENPTVQRKDAALPWRFWCSVHGLRRRPAAGLAIETLFGAAVLAELDPLAKRGAGRLAEWATGRDQGTPSIPDLISFLTVQHRRPSPPALHEQPRLSLAARRANHAFLERPIARQALLVVVGEYDRVAPVLAKPVRPGLMGLGSGSLLQNFALAIGLARLTDSPVETAAAVLAASDAEGQDRVRAVLRTWSAGLRRRVGARFRRMTGKRAVRTAPRPVLKPREGRGVSQTPAFFVSTIALRNLTNGGPAGSPRLESQQLRPSDNETVFGCWFLAQSKVMSDNASLSDTLIPRQPAAVSRVFCRQSAVTG